MTHFRINELENIKIPWYGRPPLDVWVKLKQFVYERDNGRCCYCNTLTPYEQTHCHHVLALSEGGTNHPSNLKTACHSCHKTIHPHMKSVREKLIAFRGGL